MEPEIPDFKDWTELKKERLTRYFDNRPFSEHRSYIRYEPIDKIFSGTCISFKGKEVLKVWTVPSPGEENRKLIALFLEDEKWAVSLPMYNNYDSSKIFDIQEDSKNHCMKISILTESGWKSRTIKVE
ncbi:MAG: hypothetical protein AAB626_01020 [Patescibacteria group bacterium]